MAEKFFWADQIADKIIKEKGNKKVYTCAAGVSPSGIIHIGAFREIITTELGVRALQDKGKKVRFIYSWDDFDRFRKVPANIPKKRKKEYEKYIGMPVSDIPSPSGKGKYAEYFEKPFEESLKKVGIEPEFIQQSVMNKKRKYAKLIKLAIKKKQEIIKILNKYRKEPLKKDWWPIMVYCEKCKKDSTKIMDVKGYFVEYECVCGNKNKVDFSKKGIVSVKWRVDWPMRWKYEDVDFEPSGIDHDVYGGSRMTGHEISKEVFDNEGPIRRTYEWIRPKGGKEFASSTGNVLTINEVLDIYEPEVLRYIFTRTKPKTGFQISFDNDVIKIYEDYDDLEKRYYLKDVDPKEKRIYELSQLKLNKKLPERTNFRHLITLVQIGKTKELNEFSKKRSEKVKNWLDKYSGEDMNFSIQEKVNMELSDPEKQAMISLKEILSIKDYTEDELFREFYNICEENNITNKDFFNIAYKIIINKTKGPRLASLILAVGKDKIIKLLEKIK